MSEAKNVGKGRPPKEGQFGRGQCQAPGRPQGARGEKTIIREIAGEIHEVHLSGRKQKVTTFELLLISMRDLAMGGNLRAARWLDAYRASLNIEGEKGGFLVVPEVAAIETFAKAIEIHNRHAVNPELRDDPTLAYLLEK